MRMPGSSIAGSLSARRADDVQVICFPPAGSGASYFRDWQTSAPAGIEVRPVQLPGRESRISEAPYRSFAELVPKLAHSLHPHLRGPFALFGHSLGALVAFEIARHLRSRYGAAPVALYVSGCRAPHVPRLSPLIGHLSDRHFIGELSTMYDVPREIFSDAELTRLVMPVLRADFQLFETYKYVPALPLGCPIVAFGGIDDRSITQTALKAWRAQTQSAFELHRVPGTHFFEARAKQLVLAQIAGDVAGDADAGVTERIFA